VLLTEGVRESGELLEAKHTRLLRQGEKNCWIEIVVDEGKNRHIRRMFATLEIEVLRLVRVAIGEVKLGELSRGEVRDPYTPRSEEIGNEQAKVN